ncbi:hypothetical protein FE697_012640 [Mumia zhuanghuii]|uniref:Halobacterial output domain-containing protein n=2 Tax=Mumia TaxID=1546255 RepID=A0ABW1QHH5_9ACTN|nr:MULTISPECIES: hypothetical protein [Mumia]KAA1422975.1 hypothetical protein FE697_012640 [Mumia zhuanghuii]
MRRVPEDATDEDLYQWFVAALASFGGAEEIEPDVIRVAFEDAAPDGTPEGELDELEGPTSVLVRITRSQLRSVSYITTDVFDDTDPEVIPTTSTPVWTGLDTFTFFVDEKLATLRRDERFMVFSGNDLHPSIRPELPPVRGRTRR